MAGMVPYCQAWDGTACAQQHRCVEQAADGSVSDLELRCMKGFGMTISELSKNSDASNTSCIFSMFKPSFLKSISVYRPSVCPHHVSMQ